MSSPLATCIANLRFLVVEDHGFQRWALGDLLQRMGAIEVATAADGNEALDVFRDKSRPVDIIVSDLDMPGMDGMEFLRHVSEIRTDVSVILTSSHDRALLESVESMARAYGVNLLGAVEKPVTAIKLQAAIELHRERGVARAPLPPPTFSRSTTSSKACAATNSSRSCSRRWKWQPARSLARRRWRAGDIRCTESSVRKLSCRSSRWAGAARS